eukprot:jgi/Botrbrau1/1572/Bobra.0107s0059.1
MVRYTLPNPARFDIYVWKPRAHRAVIYSSRRLFELRKRLRCVCRADLRKGDGSEQDDDVLGEILPILDPAKRAKLEEAIDLVDRLQKKQKEVEMQLMEDSRREALQKELRAREAQQVVREKEAELEKLQAEARVRAAEREVLDATIDQVKWAAAVNEDAEKLESAKAAAVAAVGGTMGSLPYLLTSGQPFLSALLSTAAVLLSSFLFGVTYRYALRKDTGNLQLKSGVVAAFGLVRGLALAEMLQYSANDSSTLAVPTIAAAALATGEAMLTFGFAAAALEFAFSRGVVKPFGAA